MEKPKEILELERTLNIELIRSHNIQHSNSYSYRNSYVLSETDEIIALNPNSAIEKKEYFSILISNCVAVEKNKR